MIRALAAAVIFALAGCSGGGPKDTSAIWAIQYSAGMPETATTQGSGFRFDFPAAGGHVNYLVHENPPLVGRFAMNGEVVASADTVFRYDTNANNTCPGTANTRFYFQRRGDDMSGNGVMQYYRWWATNLLTLAPGPFSIATALEPGNWSSVFGVRGDATPESLAAFNAAKADPIVMGLTFGGGCFAGHGVYISPGSASFAVSRFVVE